MQSHRAVSGNGGLQRSNGIQHLLACPTTVGDDLDLLRQVRSHNLAHVDLTTRGQRNNQRAVKVDLGISDRHTVLTILTVQTISTPWPHKAISAVFSILTVFPVRTIASVFANKNIVVPLLKLLTRIIKSGLDVGLHLFEGLDDDLDVLPNTLFLHSPCFLHRAFDRIKNRLLLLLRHPFKD